jgi:aldehyde dehydrogenase (NAD+)
MTTVDIAYPISDGARGLIDDPRCYIDGRWEEGEGHRLTKLNPTTGRALGEFATASAGQVARALRAARDAHRSGVWARTCPSERSAALFRLVELVQSNRELLKEVVVADVGSPVSLAEALQLEGAVVNLAWFAEAARTGPDGWYERGMTLDAPPGGIVSTGLLVREPIGVVAAITAYNFPFTLAVWKLGAALAAGCPVVLLPSPRATLSTVALWRLVEQLELPRGVVNLVLGEAEIGRQLSAAPEVDLVTFTGSVPVGAQVMGQAAPGIKRVILELGGKSPNVLLQGTDMRAAIGPSVMRLVTNAGQRCGATTRILVHEDDLEEFAEAARDYVAGVVVGDPRDPATIVGPLVDERHLESVRGHVERAIADGATILAGGGDPPSGLAGGFFMNPVLLGGLPNTSDFCQQEQFGPVGAVLTYSDVDEAVRIANESDFGLNANVFGPTPDAIAVARRIRSGTVTVNGGGRIRPDAPWGGFGHSGVGREAADDGFREFFEVKHIQWPVR